jgi:predicted CoA-substrate-specific enzyme activase
MITTGVDIGSTASKVVIIRDGRIVSQITGPSSTNPSKTAKAIYEQALTDAQIEPGQVAYVVGTGYGRAMVPFANSNISELSCHGRGAHFLLPSVRTVLDIGGQDTKAISVDAQGNLLDFVMNDKCAAGTGRFLDVMARTMGVSYDDLVTLHFAPGEPCSIGNMCSVFAESEVINLINEGVEMGRIIKGLHDSLAKRVVTLVKRVGVEPDLVITGGVAKNKGAIAALEHKLQARFVVFPNHTDPQIVGALGAALIARDHALRLMKS